MITNLIPPTTSLVAGQTDEEVNMRVRRQTEANVTYYGQGGAQAIVERLRELDREWDVKTAGARRFPFFVVSGYGRKRKSSRNDMPCKPCGEISRRSKPTVMI